MRLFSSVRAGIVVASTSALVAGFLLVPAAASSERIEAASQSITIKVAKKAIKIQGTQGLRAGRVEITAKGKGVAEVLMFERGYEFKDFQHDVAKSGHGDMPALRRAIAHTVFLGGVAPGTSGTVTLPHPGEYTVFSFGAPGVHRTMSVSGHENAPSTHVDGTIIAVRGPGWAGASELPAAGTFVFKNKDRTVPHFVVLQQVVEGTTTDQVLGALQSEEQGPPPPFMLKANLETASLSFGHKMTMDYDLPPGQYVVMCFFPDPRMHGMPHALMGMLEMIHLT